MKLYTVLASIIASTPFVAGQFSCQCLTRSLVDNNPPAIFAAAGCRETGGTLCHFAAGNSNSCITARAWTDQQCQNWAGPFPAVTRAQCSLFTGGGCTAI
ncbi:hypothetical protein BS50DRAFT_64582 [Corynespora cassiicola Philippines]|uniref:Extracellular membrane protein CFEM domain-containing protein n=1 Tax=Corynespora cassiicola Philippines TaxID=1448308 RepID=A0A2T2MZL5_CORCC|nr:hypothetical protein BS50DRAFT_64582 [Corynespora cassiicola Philippines]